jgi:putative oxidoreductase
MNFVRSKLPTAARIVLGLVFFVFGLNGFLHFLPMPPMSGPPAELMGALAATGYMFPLIKGVEVVGGLLLLLGRYVPLALTLLAPIIVNIVAFHVVLAPGGVGMLVLLVSTELYLAWAYRDAFLPMLRSNAKPRAIEVEALGRQANATA